jgi:GNAT superfamily N-acetyltransferase/protein-L-isoaspartate O-methyltransferase
VADSILGAWRDRLLGRLQPRPCPYSLAGTLEMPGRSLVASPERVLEAFDLTEGQTVLEIGPGTGFYSTEAARRLGPTGRLICLDVQSAMLRHTRSRLSKQGLSAEFGCADARHLPLRSGCVDRVVLISVLGEIPERARALAEIRRVLRRDGLLCVSEQFPDPDFVTRTALRRELAEAGFEERRSRGRLWYTSSWAPARPRAALRRAVDADRPALCRVHIRAIRETCSSAYTPEQIGAWTALLSPDSYAAVVRDRFMVVAATPLGVTGFGQLDVERGVVEAVYVLPDAQGDGIGRALLAALEHEARAAGLRELRLFATLNAVPFYERAGYVAESRTTHALPGGTDLPCLRMSKRLQEGKP